MKSNRHFFIFHLDFVISIHLSNHHKIYIIYILQYRDENKNLNYNLHKSLE